MVEWLRGRMKKAIVNRIRPLVQFENQAAPFLEPRTSVGATALFVLSPHGNASSEGFGNAVVRLNVESDRTLHECHRLRP